ncbi:MAG: hypothetical protein E7615_06185 [Ruminococcaceae bacterium]|nr:hypothetical protein [Oscillospiraceae bacterium]
MIIVLTKIVFIVLAIYQFGIYHIYLKTTSSVSAAKVWYILFISALPIHLLPPEKVYGCAEASLPKSESEIFLRRATHHQRPSPVGEGGSPLYK